MMKTAVMYEAGGPEVLRIERRPVPTPRQGEVLIRVKAFGLNRAELLARQGQRPNVSLPRILGIEAVGVVEDAPGNEVARDEIVATALGGMGFDFDGSCAEYTCVPATQVQVIRTVLSWERLGALPHMLTIAWGSLFKSLRLDPGERLFIRGGTTSVGLTAASLAKNRGAFVCATTPRADRQDLLRGIGVDQVFIDSGLIAEQVREVYPRGVDKVLELVGMSTLSDSLRCARLHGIVCMTDVAGTQRSVARFSPMDVIPPAVNLTTFACGVDDFLRTPLDELVTQIAAGTLRMPSAQVFSLDDIGAAHRWLETDETGGKVVVLT
jgi:NADPH:quinone reductase-like Zn-dependent oxidoreductase